MERLNLENVEFLENAILKEQQIHTREYAQSLHCAIEGTTQVRKPSMLSFILDIPNCISLTGLCCALSAIFCSILGYFQLAVVGILWAIFFDWLDGIVARKTRGRTENKKKFGNQIDSIIDMVSFGVFPAVFLMSYANYSLIFLPGALLLVSVAAVRLSYFTIFGLADAKHYTGLALDNNMIILSFIFLFERFFPQSAFSYILYGILSLLLLLNIAPINTPKFSGKSVYVLLAYAIALSLVYVRDFLLTLGLPL
jgi:CDP-diacylglycerol---serine O-phosphatidyltransferase